MQGAITLRVRFSCVLCKSQYCCKILHMLLCGEKFVYVRFGQYRFVSDSFGQSSMTADVNENNKISSFSDKNR